MSYLEYLFRYMSITWFAAILVVIVNRYQQIPANRKEKVVFYVATAICASLPLFPDGYIHLASNILVGAFALGMIAYSFISLLLNQARRGSTSDFFIAMSVAVIFFLSISDLIATLGVDERKYSGMTAHYGAPFLVFILSWKLIADFVSARNHAEELNRSLEARVQQKTEELKANFARVRELEQRELLAKERDRLIMDMHDGLGGQLVSAMSMLDYEKVNTDAVSDTLKDALTDLRMMIDALDPVCDDLAMVLGSFRQRLDKALAGSNTKLVWRVQDVPAMEELNPHVTLQILRILQEAVNNAVKYAEATEITVATGTENNRIYLSVADNGKGLQAESEHGRGLQNMRRRAESINATLNINSGLDGVELKLLLKKGDC